VVRDKNTGSIRIFLGGYRHHSFGVLKDDFEQKKSVFLGVFKFF